ncbi:hypothetical protein EJ03DRAFT_355043 [Teratosphaeria nubilosa]|uniref:Uncharacterized protein n=1 Tax=Teratosphaeria nubilosa TaxID=161662 RepID=A0A6G1KXV7_9PEZI|nr:hypothetical protein EJ03DRAFT_355043 [Teratosphaeria nubilosa]
MQQQLRLATTATLHDHQPTHQDGRGQLLHSAERPFGQDITTWLRLLEPRLPAHLRDVDTETPIEQASVSNAEEIASILCDASDVKANSANQGKAHDLLTYLGSHQGRWPTVMWLIKSVVEDFPSSMTAPAQSASKDPWGRCGPLSEITRQSLDIELDQLDAKSHVGFLPLDHHPDMASSETVRVSRHQALGRIWLSLGNMILRNEGNIVKPEILEIIAYLHHRGIIPSSIYSQKPRTDVTAIQQPPTLHLLSSRILVALSDAAWRAHEKLVIEEAKAKGGDYAAIRPEIPGAAYRVHVEGLSREIWIELVLWSCLHGGWFQAGARILLNICRWKKSQWKPLAWRTLLETDTADFDSIAHLVHTRAAAFEQVGESGRDIQDTVSSEVVNAYIDAMLSGLDSQEQGQRLSIAFVLGALYKLREFLERSQLRLSGGSWDAIVTRLAERRGTEDLSPEIVRHLIQLSPGFGTEISTAGAQGLPSYVLDGNASVLGLAHRALHHQISRGDLEAALKVLRLLRDYTDSNKHESLRDFFTTIRENTGPAADASALFTSNYAPIDYPGFHLQIPSTTLGPLLELATTAGDIQVGTWLLHDQELDGPVIPRSLYSDPAIAPALVRFATRTSDRQLLSQVVSARAEYNAQSKAGPTMPNAVIQSFLDTQITLRRWEAVIRILEYIRDTETLTWNVVNLAYLARTILYMRSENDPELAHAMEIFTLVIQNRFDYGDQTAKQSSLSGLILLTMLASVDRLWLSVIPNITGRPRFANFDTNASAFNVILDGVVSIHGAVAGRQLLQLFWSQATRRSLEGVFDHRSQRGARLLRIELLHDSGRQRMKITYSGPPERSIVIQGGVQPDIATIRIIYRRALQESHGGQKKNRPSGRGASVQEASDQAENAGIDDRIHNALDDMTLWAIRSFWALGASRRATEKQIGGMMSELGHPNLAKRLPSLIEQAEDLRDSDVVVSENIGEDEGVDLEQDDGALADYEPSSG